MLLITIVRDKNNDRNSSAKFVPFQVWKLERRKRPDKYVIMFDLHFQRLPWIYCSRHTGFQRKDRTDRLADKATIRQRKKCPLKGPQTKTQDGSYHHHALSSFTDDFWFIVLETQPWALPFWPSVWRHQHGLPVRRLQAQRLQSTDPSRTCKMDLGLMSYNFELQLFSILKTNKQTNKQTSKQANKQKAVDKEPEADWCQCYRGRGV